MSKVGSNYIFLVVVLIYIVLKNESFNQRSFLKNVKEYKKKKENKVIRYITDDLETFSDYSAESSEE